MSHERITIDGLDHEDRAHVARAIREFATASEEHPETDDAETIPLDDDPEDVAERIRHGDDVELRYAPDEGVDEVRYVLCALDYQLDRIDEGKPDRAEDRDRSRSKRKAMSDRGHLFQRIRDEAAERGLTYDDDEVHVRAR